MRRTATLALVLLLAAGCTATRPAQHYLLSAPHGGGGAAGPVLGIGPITLPDYLDRPQIVTRTSDHELDFAEHHRWAEPLEGGFTAALAENIAGRTGSESVYRYPWSGSPEIDCRVTGSVTRFDVGPSGEAVLIAHWQVVRGPEAPESQRSRYTSPATPGDYPTIVAALSDTVAQLGAQVAEACLRISPAD